MVGMLGDMYGKMKERIAHANAAEKKEKASFDDRIKDLEAKKKALAAKGIKTTTRTTALRLTGRSNGRMPIV